MPCPNCQSPMLILELEGIELDHCAACGGTWLDAGELETIAERAGAPPGGLAALLARAREGAKGERRCPRCRARLRRATVSDADGAPPVEIDRCPRGHGIWLDPGEAARLAEAAAAGDDAERRAIARFFADALGGVL